MIKYFDDEPYIRINGVYVSIDGIIEENKRMKSSVDAINEDRRAMQIISLEKDKKIEQLKEVTEEVREYIKENKLFNYVYDEEELFEIVSDKKAKEQLLQILDKVKESERMSK